MRNRRLGEIKQRAFDMDQGAHGLCVRRMRHEGGAMCSHAAKPNATSCDGRCQSGGCKKGSPRCWLLVACSGMTCLFEKQEDVLVLQHEHGQSPTFKSPTDLADFLEHAVRDRQFDQLVMIGSENDMAWMHAMLAPEVTQHITAEITYPLLVEWFQESGLTQLIQTLRPLIQ